MTEWASQALARLDRTVGSVERNLRAVYGGAQVDPQEMGTQPQPAAHRLQGVAGRYEVHHDSTGRTYLVPRRPEGGKRH